MKVTFTLITRDPKTWGVRVSGKGKKGMKVESINRWGATKPLVLVSKVAEVPANEFTGQPAGEIWTFQNA